MPLSKLIQGDITSPDDVKRRDLQLPHHVAMTFPRFFRTLINYCKLRRLSTAEKAAIITDFLMKVYALSSYLFAKGISEVTVDFCPKGVLNVLNVDPTYVEDLVFKNLYRKDVDFRIVVYEDLSGITTIKVVPEHDRTKRLNILINYDYVTELKLVLLKVLLELDTNFTNLTLDSIYEFIGKLKKVLPVSSDPDLLIVFGEYEFPNFIPLNLSYTEFVFINKDIAAISYQDIDMALVEYSRRYRRFGR